MGPKMVFLNAHQLCKRVVARQKLGYSHLEPSKVDKSLRLVADLAKFHGRLRELDLKTEKESYYRAVITLKSELDTLFASLPRTKGLTLDTFYANKLRVLKIAIAYHAKRRQKTGYRAVTSLKDKLDANLATTGRQDLDTLPPLYHQCVVSCDICANVD